MKLTDIDRKILESYCTFVEGLGEYLGEGYEIVIHSLESLDNSAIKLVNGFHSGRKEGAPITDLALQMLAQMEHNQNKALCYFNKSKEGAPIKSTTIPLVGEDKRIIGLICMNFYMDTPLSALISNFSPKEQIFQNAEQDVAETFSENKDELISHTLSLAKEAVYANPTITSSNRNKEIINLLYEKGIFNLKDAVVQVAALLNISKNTVYMHLRKLM